MLDVVLVTLHAWFDHAHFGGHVVGVDQPHFGRHLRRRRDHQHAASAGALHGHEEAIVVFLVDEDIRIGRRSDGVAPDLPRPHRVVGPGEEHRAVVVRPHDPVVHVGYDVVEVGVRAGVGVRVERAEAQVVSLAARRVGGVRGDGLGGIHREVADGEVVVRFGELVLVEHHRLTRRAPGRRIGVRKSRGAGRAPAVHVVLLALDGPRKYSKSPRRTGADASVWRTRPTISAYNWSRSCAVCASDASVYVFSASRYARTSGSSRSRNQNHGSTRSSPRWRSVVGRTGATGGLAGSGIGWILAE